MLSSFAPVCCLDLLLPLMFHLRFKPVQVTQLVAPVREEFEQLFHATFSVKQNAQFLASVQVGICSLLVGRWGIILCVCFY